MIAQQHHPSYSSRSMMRRRWRGTSTGPSRRAAGGGALVFWTARFASGGVAGGMDEGPLGVSGRARISEPRFLLSAG